MAEPLEIKQGTTRIIVVSQLRDAAKQPLDPTGWTIHAVARPGVWGPVVAEWVSGTPGEDQGLAEVVDAEPDIDPSVTTGEKWIYLHITPTWSDTWTWSRADLDIEIHEPGPDGREETFSRELKLIPTTVRP